jgi:hypothetical protein
VTPAVKSAPAWLLDRPVGTMSSAFRVGDARLRDCSPARRSPARVRRERLLDAPRSWTL